MGGETEDAARFEAGRRTPNGYWDTLLADFIEQVQEIITVGEFYEHGSGGQIIFTYAALGEVRRYRTPSVRRQRRRYG